MAGRRLCLDGWKKSYRCLGLNRGTGLRENTRCNDSRGSSSWDVATKSTVKGRIAQVGITFAAAGMFLLIRPDCLQVVEAHYTKVSSPHNIQQYLDSTKVRKLQLGAGANNLKGWLNTDIIPSGDQVYLDATERFPLPDASFQYVFAEHVVEHITYEQAVGMLQECRRVMAPGAKIRLVTPNLERFLALFNKTKTEEQTKYMVEKTKWHEWPTTSDQETYILNMQLREWGHMFVYTPKMLIAALEKTGFRDVREFSAGVSGSDGFQGADAREGSRVSEINRYEAMAIEGTR